MCQSLYQTACTMTTSIEIAEKVVEEAEEEIEGLDALSAYIESVLARTGLKFSFFFVYFSPDFIKTTRQLKSSCKDKICKFEFFISVYKKRLILNLD